jgi:hypothetical protein
LHAGRESVLVGGMASLRSQGFVPKMVKVDTGNTVSAHTSAEILTIWTSFAKLLGLLKACSDEEWDALPEFIRNSFPADESHAVRFAEENAALSLVLDGEEIEVPEIQTLGFNPPVKRNFWGAIIA